jgi:hypothetical protein
MLSCGWRMCLARATYEIEKVVNAMMDLKDRSLGWEMAWYLFIIVEGAVYVGSCYLSVSSLYSGFHYLLSPQRFSLF